ncbi:MAG: polysaccharide biosynthesis tyrosine autokinase, partial [Isosphaeraceae bacterium]
MSDPMLNSPGSLNALPISLPSPAAMAPTLDPVHAQAAAPSGGFVDDLRAVAVIARQWWRILAVTTGVALAVATVYLVRAKPGFLGTSRLIVTVQGKAPLAVASGESGRIVESHEDYLPTHALIIRSPAVVGRALQSIERDNLSPRAVIERLAVTRPDPMAKVLLVSYRSPDPAEALELVGAIIASYQEFLDENSRKSNKDLSRLLSNARDGLGRELQDLEQQYLELKRASSTLGIDEAGRSFPMRRLDQWDRAAGEAMIREVQLRTQLDLGRKLAAEGAATNTLAQALDQVGGGLPASYWEARISPREQLEAELISVEVQANSAESVVDELDRAERSLSKNGNGSGIASSLTSGPVDELTSLFLAQPGVEALVNDLRLARRSQAEARRSARSLGDPSVVTIGKRVDSLTAEVDRLWQTSRSALLAQVRRERGTLDAETTVITARARERAIRDKLDQLDDEALRRLEQERTRLARTAKAGDPRLVALDEQITRARRGGASVHAAHDAAHDLLGSVARSLEAIELMRAEIGRRFEAELAVARAAEDNRLREAALAGNLERHRGLFNAVVDQLKQVQLSGDFSGISAQVIDPPSVDRVRPQAALILALALLGGSGVGLGIAVVAERMDQRLRSLSDIRRVLGIPPIGRIPRLTSVDTPGGLGMLGHAMPNSPVAEAYRAVRTQIDFHRRTRQLQVILVTSPSPGDGKTTTVSNLAITLAQAGRRVLLVDADFRRPTIHRLYDVPRDPGLSDVLLGRLTAEQVIRSSPVYNLDLLPAGAEVSNPAELLLSPALRKLLAGAREVYDTVLVDSPP